MTKSKMTALVKARDGPGLDLVSRDVPEIGADDVLIKINRTGICGTDLHIWSWNDWARETVPIGMVVGHEYAGEIVEMGSRVQGHHLGERVSGEGHLVGTASRAARAGRFHLDPETKGVGVNIPGAFAEFLRLPAFNLVPLPDDVDDDVGAILDPLGNAVHTALSFDCVGEDILITGAGPIGIMAAIVARHIGARHIVITDVNQDRLNLAASIVDATPINTRNESIQTVSHRLGLKEGFDIGFEMSGSPQAFSEMVDNLIMGGRIAFLGIPAKPFEVDWNTIIFKAITVKGVYGREMFETWYKMIAMLQSGLDVRRVVTGVYPVAKYEDAFQFLTSGGPGKVVLDWQNID